VDAEVVNVVVISAPQLFVDTCSRVEPLLLTCLIEWRAETRPEYSAHFVSERIGPGRRLVQCQGHHGSAPYATTLELDARAEFLIESSRELP
jgi:hypothetical protein